jgi:hypothetical protein
MEDCNGNVELDPLMKKGNLSIWILCNGKVEDEKAIISCLIVCAS